MKSIYRYKDYRELLSDAYLEGKRESLGYTYASFALKAGVKSPNYLKLVIDGKRNLTPANIQAFAKALRLAGDEVDVFEAMVLENQSETPAERSYYRRRLARFKAHASQSVERKSPNQLLEGELRTPVLLCALGQTREQAITRAARELAIAEKAVESMLDSLMADGDLVLGESSLGQPECFQAPSRHTMMTDPKGLSERQRLFLKAGLDEAQTVFTQRYPKGAAKFLSLLLTAPEGSLPALFSNLRTAAEKAAEKFDPSPEEEAGVYRIQFQIYRTRKNQD